MTTLSDYQVSYQVSPIVLVGGVAGTGMLPLVSVLSSRNYKLGLLGTDSQTQIESFFGQFRVLPGHTLIDNETATFPLANQRVAANAVITNPLQISLEMLAPATSDVPVSTKLAIFNSLKSTLDNHTALGGWYNVATPSYIYQGCLLASPGLVDATDDLPGGQPQVRWLWHFIQPLLTEAAAQAAQNQAMAKISNQTRNTGDPPGSQPVSTGVSQPSANIVQNIVPAAANPVGSNVAPGSIVAGTPDVRSVSPILPTGTF